MMMMISSRDVKLTTSDHTHSYTVKQQSTVTCGEFHVACGENTHVSVSQ